jgi:hypothetical protein
MNVLQVLTDKLTTIVNSEQVLNAQKYIAKSHTNVTDQLQHDEVGYTAKLANDAIKLIESHRKEITKPLDDAKKVIMNIEKEAIAPLQEYVAKAKTMMLDYAADQKRKQDEANAKMQEQAQAALDKSTTPDILGGLIDQAATITIDQPKNIRTTIKARTNGTFVDWAEVIDVLILADKFDPEWLLKGLPEAMRITGVEKVKGIELYEHHTQVIR